MCLWAFRQSTSMSDWPPFRAGSAVRGRQSAAYRSLLGTVFRVESNPAVPLGPATAGTEESVCYLFRIRKNRSTDQ